MPDPINPTPEDIANSIGDQPTIQPLGYTANSEKDDDTGNGWYHALQVKFGDATITIVDDTDFVECYSDQPNIDKSTIAKIWEDYGMGTSTFPTQPVPQSPIPIKLNGTKVYTGTGEELSAIYPKPLIESTTPDDIAANMGD